MRIFVLILSLVIIVFPSSALSGGPESLEIMMEYPKKEFIEIDTLVASQQVIDLDYLMHQSVVQELQNKARGLRANAIVIKSIKKFHKVTTEKENYNIDPSGVKYFLSTFLTIEATAIKYK